MRPPEAKQRARARRKKPRPALTVLSPKPTGPSLAIALGGGGARGIAHIPILEALDELGVTPALVAGTSIGALIGAAYASGMSGADIRLYCQELLQKRTQIIRRLFSHRSRLFADPRSASSLSVFAGERVVQALMPETLPKTFGELKIPLLAVTTDFYVQSQYVVSEGPLLPAIVASSALPGVLRPIELDGRVLVDGGFVNPVPFDLLNGRAEIVAAIDVCAGPQQSRGQIPSLIDAIVGSNQITMRSVMREKLKSSAPDILIRPDIDQFRVLDFFKIDEILAAAESGKDEFKRRFEVAMQNRQQRER